MIIFKYLFLEIKDLGVCGSLYRIIYEFGWRSRFYIVFENFKKKKVQKWQPSLHLAEWIKGKNPFFIDGINEKIKHFLHELPDTIKKNIAQVADNSISGKILCFSKWYASYGSPINWHLNPKTGKQWPKNLHWSKALRDSSFGDVKLVWEVNRFPHIYYLVRAYYLTGDKKYITAYINHIEKWVDQNPFQKGINWSSGQELSIRLIAWIFGLYNFYKENVITDKDFRLILKQIYLHAWHINHNINYAYYSVHNNHLIGEAVALYITGTLFPFMPGAKKWKDKGKKILCSKAIKQFYPDGGYCQLSHTYHRLVLHYYIWAIRIAELNSDQFDKNIKQKLFNSTKFLYQNMNVSDGRLPNWGNNDGALLNPWTVCDYTNFKPVIALLYRVAGYKSPFPKGTWDEETIWFMHDQPIDSNAYPQLSVSYKNTGIHIVRNSGNDYCILRCGTPQDRFGQADQLHLDLFWDGYNLAVDGGSYLYNDDLHYHTYFAGTKSHNTVIIDNQDQMLLWRRFKWLYKTSARLIEFNKEKKIISGEHYGYKRIDPGLVHVRRVNVRNDYLTIEDTVKNQLNKKHHYLLHWQFDVDEMISIDHAVYNCFHLRKKEKKYYLYIWMANDQDKKRIDCKLLNGWESGQKVDGWCSRYYGQKDNIYALQCISIQDRSSQFHTVISKKQLNEVEVIECGSF